MKSIRELISQSAKFILSNKFEFYESLVKYGDKFNNNEIFDVWFKKGLNFEWQQEYRFALLYGLSKGYSAAGSPRIYQQDFVFTYDKLPYCIHYIWCKSKSLASDFLNYLDLKYVTIENYTNSFLYKIIR